MMDAVALVALTITAAALAFMMVTHFRPQPRTQSWAIGLKVGMAVRVCTVRSVVVGRVERIDPDGVVLDIQDGDRTWICGTIIMQTFTGPLAEDMLNRAENGEPEPKPALSPEDQSKILQGFAGADR